MLEGFEVSEENAKFWWELASKYLQAGQYEAALVSFDRALELKPDYYPAWNNRGYALNNLGRYEEALESCDRALALNRNNYLAWNNRGNALSDLDRYEEALESYDRALALKADYYQAWYNRSLALAYLEQYEEVVKSCDRVLNLNRDSYKIWQSRDNTFSELGKNEEVVASFDLALEPKLNDYQVWYMRGYALSELGKNEEAVASFDLALKLKPDFYKAWYMRGNALNDLGKHEEAVESYDRAVGIKSDFNVAWRNRGNALNDLGKHEEAVESYDRALKLKLDDHIAWSNRGFAIGQLPHDIFSIFIMSHPDLTKSGYQGTLATCRRGLEHCPSDTYPEGWGLLHYGMGQAHHFHSRFNISRRNRRHYFNQAKQEYLTALETLKDFPEWHLQVLRHLAKVYSALGQPEEADEVMRQGSDVLYQYLATVPSPGKKRQLEFEFADFQQTTVDRLARDNQPVEAWELAERGKNTCLRWWLRGYTEEFVSATVETAASLSKRTHAAFVYWHCSPSALNAFLLQPGQPPRLLNSSTSATERHAAFQQWWEEWNQDYLDYREAKDKANPDPEHPWRTQLPERLTQLKHLLDIDGIVAELSPPDSAEPYSIPLVLLPHKELHLVPLEALFPDCFAITRLPSVQTGLALQEEPRQSTTALLSLECPTKDLPMAFFEAAAIRHLYAATALEGDNATPTATLEHLKSAYRYCHFTGHSLHEFPHPDRSLLYLAKGESLTLRQLVEEAENLSSYDWVSLSACETGIARDTDFVTEYVGWASGFLAMGAKCVASSLWLVQSDASALLMVRFYELLREGDVPSVARGKAVAWLRQLTANSLIAWYDDWLTRLERNSRAFLALERRKRQQSKIKERDTPLFDDPYFWAALTVVGLD
ncbi:TPR domain protein putative component of TonB system [Geitlerinema sp. FC II]|nr:TPR domain protein putative component of TonB system [Geitlerinema sp. FC II]